MSELAVAPNRFYVTGGTMPPDAPSYVERDADRELHEALLAGEYCYLLTPRQMGKSSLMARAAERLRREGVETAIMDLTGLGSDQQEPESWYLGIAHEIHRSMHLPGDLSEWWRERRDLPPVKRLKDFFEEKVLAGGDQGVVVFFDEIDSTIKLPFSDDFFAAIRACYNARASEPRWKRLSFVLIGVATPSELIRDVERTPFNIGRRIELADFTPEEARPLAAGLHSDPDQQQRLLEQVLHWTGGHPYLTQVASREVAGRSDQGVDAVIESLFFSPRARREETNLRSVADRLLSGGRPLLALYRRVRQNRTVPDRPAAPLHAALKLTGVVRVDDAGVLRVRNRVYETVFSPEWIRNAMPADWSRRVAAGAVSVALAVLAGWYTVLLPRSYINTLRTASSDENFVFQAYESLRRIPLRANLADDLLVRFWERREDRDTALLYRLRSLVADDTVERRREAGQLSGSDYSRLLFTFRHSGSAGAVAFSPYGRAVLTGSADRTAQLWSLESGRPIGPPLRHPDRVSAVAFSPNGRRLLTGCPDGTARLWQLETGQMMGHPIRHGTWVTAVAFSPDGQIVLTASKLGPVRRWEAASGRPLGPPLDPYPDLPLDRDYGPTSAVAFSPNGKIVLTGARLWRLDNGRPITSGLHTGSTAAAAFRADGAAALTIDLSGTARLWQADNGEPLGSAFLSGYATVVALSPDGATALTASDDGTVRLWRLDTGQPVDPPLRHGAPVAAAAFSPDGAMVVTGSFDGATRLWRVGGQAVGVPHSLREGGVRQVAFSADGRTLLAGRYEGAARLWRVDTSQAIGAPLRHEGMSVVALSADGRTALTGDPDGMVRLWRAETGQPLGPPLKLQGPLTAAALSPNAQTVLGGSGFGDIQLWSLKDRQPIGPLLRHGIGDVVTAAAFSLDGATFLTASTNGTAWLGRVDIHQEIGPVLQVGASIKAAAFAPESARFVLATNAWLHAYSMAEGFAQHARSYLLPAPVIRGGLVLPRNCKNCAKLALYHIGDSLIFHTVNLDRPDAPPLQGDPKALLEEWQKRLGLRFDESGRLRTASLP